MVDQVQPFASLQRNFNSKPSELLIGEEPSAHSYLKFTMDHAAVPRTHKLKQSSQDRSKFTNSQSTSQQARAVSINTCVVPFDGLNIDALMTDSNAVQCPECGKQFPNRYKFKRHYMIHTGEKPFQCLLCDFKCNQNDNLKYHVAFKHRTPANTPDFLTFWSS